MLAMDALRYSLNIPSVQMQYLVGSQTTAEFSESLGIASAEYIMDQDPGLSLALGSVPLNLTNMTQAYSTFAQQGELHTNTTILEIRNRDGRIVYTREDNGPEVTEPMTDAEAYLTHSILEGNTDPDRNLLWGERAQLNTPDGQRRPAGFKTGTTNDFRDVSGFGYVPESLVTGVWMGNNNQEPMSQRPRRRPVQRRRAALPVAGVHDAGRSTNRGPGTTRQPVGQTGFQQPDGIVNAEVCRWSGLAAPAVAARPSRSRSWRERCPPVDYRAPGRLPRPRAVRLHRNAGPARQLDRGRRHLVRPHGQRPDRGVRGPGRTTRTTRMSGSRSRRSTASPASRPSAASASSAPRRRPAPRSRPNPTSRDRHRRRRRRRWRRRWRRRRRRRRRRRLTRGSAPAR